MCDKAGTNMDFICDLSSLGTKTLWNIFASFEKKRGMDLNVKNMYASRVQLLDKENDILNLIA
jgi:hypothetical protein